MRTEPRPTVTPPASLANATVAWIGLGRMGSVNRDDANRAGYGGYWAGRGETGETRWHALPLRPGRCVATRKNSLAGL
jgi:hypothetical protein